MMSNLQKADQALAALVAAESRATHLGQAIINTVAAGLPVAPANRVEYARARIAARAAEDAYLAAAAALPTAVAS